MQKAMKTAASLILMTILLASVSAPALSALNWRELKYSPVAYFTDEDWRLFTETGEDLLNNHPDGTTLAWENPTTGSSGSVTAVSTSERNGMVCREVKIVNSAGPQTAQSIFHLCKQADGSWKFDH